MAVLWCILAALIVIYLGFTFFLFYISCWRFNMGPRLSRFIGGNGKQGPDWDAPDQVAAIQKGRVWLAGHASENIYIKSFDGLKLKAAFYENPDAKGILVACHGFRSRGDSDFAAVCPYYYGLGFSLLLIDQRACGDSEGKFVTYGVHERRDVQDWCRLMAERYPGMPILLGGISLGGATVLMASDDLPDEVKVILADCGFSSPWQQLEFIGKRTVNIPIAPVLWGVDLWCRLLAHFGLKQWSVQQALANNTRPICFIHGERDNLVSHSCTVANMAACAAPTALLSVPDAGHGMSYLRDTQGYYRVVGGFLDRYFFPADMS